ncbi:deoxyribose-phosphate aldolase [Cutibacterium acnes JCM 18920]|nr:deoxyribose-phosphate aldolase [Cutibacterium acnes JCM 18920]
MSSAPLSATELAGMIDHTLLTPEPPTTTSPSWLPMLKNMGRGRCVYRHRCCH